MLFFVVGLRSGFADWCDRLVMQLAGLGAAAPLAADTLEQIAAKAVSARLSSAVVSVRQPGGRLRTALLESGRRFVVADADPRTALLDLVLGGRLDLPSAVQAVASGCAAARALAASDAALVLHGDRDWCAETAVAVARHLELPVTEVEAEEAGAALMAAAGPQQHDAVAWWNGLPPADQQMVTGALQPYVDGAADAGPLSITWAADLFFVGDQPNQRATGPVDITGRARCLLQGPFIAVPPGAWSLSLSLQLSRTAAEHEYAVEVSTDRGLAHGTMRPHDEGAAQIDLEFVLDETGDAPLTIRISTVRAAFDGAIAIGAARLDRRL